MMHMQMPMMPMKGYGGGGFDGGYGPPGGYGKGAPMHHGMGMHQPMAYAGYGGKGGLPGPQAFIGQQLEGTVLSWKELWGWISSPAFGGDIFAHKEDLKGSDAPSGGERVHFTAGTDNK